MARHAPPLSSRTSTLGPFRQRWGHSLALALILAIAAVIRFWGLDDQSIWFDEGWSIHVAEQSLPEALRLLASAGHTHPPGYYILLMGWLRLWGVSVVAARALSALLGVWAVWQIYRLGESVFDARTGLASAAILALSPAHIVYSQEVRMYALLLLTLTAVWQLTYRLGVHREGWGKKDWATLIAWEIAAIYTHFFAFLPLVTVMLWLLVQLLRRASTEGYRTFRQWLMSQAIVAIAFIPWIGIALQRTVEHTTIGTSPPHLIALTSEVWAFLLGGHLALLGREALFARLATTCLVMVAILAVWRLAFTHDRGRIAFLGLQVLGPFVLVFAMMQVRPGFHPRYTLMLLVPVAVLLARGALQLAEGRWWHKVAAGTVVVIWILTVGTAAQALISDPYYRRDDARATAAYLQKTLPDGAPVLLSIDDWALQYYLRGTALSIHLFEAARDAAALEQECADLLAEHSQAALVQWYQGTSDLRGVLPYMLERQGRLTDRERLSGYTVATYSLDTSTAPQVRVDAGIRFGAITLESLQMETGVASDDALAVALDWIKETPLEANLKVALDVVDVAGRSCASADTLLRDEHGDGTEEWDVGKAITTFARLDLPPGLPPLTYTLRVSLYDEETSAALNVLDLAGAPAGQHVDVGSLVLAPAAQRFAEPPAAETLRLATEIQAFVAPGLRLLGANVKPGPISTGEKVEVALGWYQAADESLPNYEITLRLVREGEVLASESRVPGYGQYPADRWTPGEVVLDYRELSIPTDVSGGKATLQLVVEEGKPVNLAEVLIEVVPRSFTPPGSAFAVGERLGTWADLVGYDLPDVLQAGQPFTLTLHWYAAATPAQSLVVFTHLLDSQGRLLAQHDGIPCQGQRPTTSWISGEYLSDPHRLEWVVPAYQGGAVLEVGLYDPQTNERLLTPAGSAQILLSPQISLRP